MSPQSVQAHRCYLFFFNDTAATEIYTLSLHDALPICSQAVPGDADGHALAAVEEPVHRPGDVGTDRKSTRLNSSHDQISYAGLCLKKKIAGLELVAHLLVVSRLAGGAVGRRPR